MNKPHPYSYPSKQHNPPITSSQTLSKPQSHSSHHVIMSLKPHGFAFPKDINIQSIYSILKHNINPSQQKKIDLTNPTLKTRLTTLSKIRLFLIKYKLKPDSFYLATFLLDTLLTKKLKLPIEKIGLGALIIAVKFTDIDGKTPMMSMFREVLDYSISLRELVHIEMECIKKLSYDLLTPHPFSFIQLFLVYGILFNSDKENGKNAGSMYTMPNQILDCVMLDSPLYYKYNPLYLACACVALTREMYGFCKWNDTLISFCGVALGYFKEEFDYVKSMFQNKKKNACTTTTTTTQGNMSNSSVNIFDGNITMNKLNLAALVSNNGNNTRIQMYNKYENSMRESKEINCVESYNNKNQSKSYRNNTYANNNDNNNNNKDNSISTITITNGNEQKRKQMTLSAKPLELNMAQLEEMVRNHKKEHHVERNTHLNPIQEINESSNLQEEMKTTKYLSELKQRNILLKKNVTSYLLTKSLANFNQTIETSTSSSSSSLTSSLTSHNIKRRIANNNNTNNTTYNISNTETGSSSSNTLLTSISSTITPLMNSSSKSYASKYANGKCVSNYQSYNTSVNNSLRKTLVTSNTTTNMSLNKCNNGIVNASNRNGYETTRNGQGTGNIVNGDTYMKNKGCIGFKTTSMLNTSYSTTDYDKVKNGKTLKDYCIQFPRGKTLK